MAQAELIGWRCVGPPDDLAAAGQLWRPPAEQEALDSKFEQMDAELHDSAAQETSDGFGPLKALPNATLLGSAFVRTGLGRSLSAAEPVSTTSVQAEAEAADKAFARVCEDEALAFALASLEAEEGAEAWARLAPHEARPLHLANQRVQRAHHAPLPCRRPQPQPQAPLPGGGGGGAGQPGHLGAADGTWADEAIARSLQSELMELESEGTTAPEGHPRWSQIQQSHGEAASSALELGAAPATSGASFRNPFANLPLLSGARRRAAERGPPSTDAWRPSLGYTPSAEPPRPRRQQAPSRSLSSPRSSGSEPEGASRPATVIVRPAVVGPAPGVAAAVAQQRAAETERRVMRDSMAQARVGFAVPGARPESLAATTSTMLHREGENGGGPSQGCSICCENFRDGEQLRLLPCLHRYHAACVDRWLAQSRTCPVCKHDITGG